MRLVMILMLSLYLLALNAQEVWKYERIQDNYNTIIKRSFVIDSTGYSTLNIDKYFNYDLITIYLSNVGYFVCENNQLFINFDNEKITYKVNVYTDDTYNKWILDLDNNWLIFILNKLRLSLTTNIIIKSDCINKHYVFSLKQSNKIIKKTLN